MIGKSFIHRVWQYRIVRFGCVGAVNTLTDVALLNILVFGFNLKLLAGNTLSTSITIVLSYFWNNIVVFQNQHRRSLRLFVKFAVVTGLSILLVQNLIIYGVVHAVSLHMIERLTDVSESAAQLLQVNGAKAIAVVGSMTWNFVLYQTLVFKDPQKTPATTEQGIMS